MIFVCDSKHEKYDVCTKEKVDNMTSGQDIANYFIGEDKACVICFEDCIQDEV